MSFLEVFSRYLRKTRIVVSIIWILGSSSFVHANIGNLFMSPNSIRPSSGDIEYGIMYQIGTIDELPTGDAMGFLNVGITNWIELNTTFYQGRFYGSIAAEIFHSKTFYLDQNFYLEH